MQILADVVVAFYPRGAHFGQDLLTHAICAHGLRMKQGLENKREEEILQNDEDNQDENAAEKSVLDLIRFVHARRAVCQLSRASCQRLRLGRGSGR